MELVAECACQNVPVEQCQAGNKSMTGIVLTVRYLINGIKWKYTKLKELICHINIQI